MFLEKLENLEKQSKERGIPILGSEKGSWLIETFKYQIRYNYIIGNYTYLCM